MSETGLKHFPESTFGCNPDEYREKKARVEETFVNLVKQTGGVKKANSFLNKIEKDDDEATGKELTQAVKADVGLSAEQKIYDRTGMNPSEFIAEQLLNVIAEPEITVSVNEKTGLSYQIKSQPSTKVKALDSLSRLTNANKEGNDIKQGVAALPISTLLDMQAKLQVLTDNNNRENSAQTQGPQANETELIDVIEDTAGSRKAEEAHRRGSGEAKAG